MRRSFTKMGIAIVAMLTVSSVSAQERVYVRDQITNAGKCQNVVITETHGDLAIIDNSYVARGIPRSLLKALDEVKANGGEIVDVCLTEEGRWVVLYGANGVMPHGIPEAMENSLRQYNAAGSRITSATLTDNGEWIVVTADSYNASDEKLLAWLKEGAEQLGVLWSACLTEKGVVACYSGGVRYQGDIPQSLKDAIDKATIDIYRLKVAGSAWFFADKKGVFNYSM